MTDISGLLNKRKYSLVLGMKPLIRESDISEEERKALILNLIAYYKEQKNGAFTSDIEGISSLGYNSYQAHINLSRYWPIIKGCYTKGAQERLFITMFLGLCAMYPENFFSFLDNHHLYDDIFHKEETIRYTKKILADNDITPMSALSLYNNNLQFKGMLLEMLVGRVK